MSPVEELWLVFRTAAVIEARFEPITVLVQLCQFLHLLLYLIYLVSMYV